MAEMDGWFWRSSSRVVSRQGFVHVIGEGILLGRNAAVVLLGGVFGGFELEGKILTRTVEPSDRYPAPSTAGSSGRAFVIAGAVCAVVALFFLPIVFGPVGAVLAFVGYGRGYRAGLWVGIAAIVATLGGMALGAWVLTHAHHSAPR